jgi:hypothetical protein
VGCGFHYGYDLCRGYLRIERMCGNLVWNDLKGYLLQILPKGKDVYAKLKIKLSYIRLIFRMDRLLPVGHRWRGDVV